MRYYIALIFFLLFFSCGGGEKITIYQHAKPSPSLPNPNPPLPGGLDLSKYFFIKLNDLDFLKSDEGEMIYVIHRAYAKLLEYENFVFDFSESNLYQLEKVYVSLMSLKREHEIRPIYINHPLPFVQHEKGVMVKNPLRSLKEIVGSDWPEFEELSTAFLEVLFTRIELQFQGSDQKRYVHLYSKSHEEISKDQDEKY